MPDSNDQLHVDWWQVRDYYMRLRNDHIAMLMNSTDRETTSPDRLVRPNHFVRTWVDETDLIPGVLRNLPIFDPRVVDGHLVAIPEPQPVKEHRPMQHQTPTEQTMVTVLQQGVADAIAMLNNIAGVLKAQGVTALHLRFPYGFSFHLRAPLDECYLELQHNGTELNMPDTYDPMVRGDHYSYTKRICAPALVSLHPAFLDALASTLDPSSGESSRNLEILREHQIDGIEEFFARHPTRFSIYQAPGDSGIPQLYLRRDQISSNSAHQGVSFDPHTPLWQVREQARLQFGVYTALPDALLEHIPEEVMRTQIPHLAIKGSNVGMIAYTQSPVAGMMDRQQVIKPGRYIKQHCPGLTDQQVKELAAACLGSLTAGFHHSREADDYANVYINGPSSCMAYDDDSKYWSRLKVGGKFFHPCRIYAHPENDLEIVWLEVNERIAARAIVNKANMRYPRIYASDSVSNAYRRMEDYLDNLGYSQCNDALAGQKLLRVSPDNYPDAIICPYIDHYNLGVQVYNDHLFTERGYYEANHETGCLHSYDTDCEPDWYCDCCGEGMSDGEDQNETTDHEAVCDSCIDSSYTRAYCADRGGYVYTSDDLYTDRSPRFNQGVIYVGSGWGDYVALDDTIYESDEVAHMDYVTSTADDTYILTCEAGQHGFAIDRDENIAYPTSEWVLLDDEFVEGGQIDDGEHEYIETRDDGLRLFRTRDCDEPQTPETGEAA